MDAIRRLIGAGLFVVTGGLMVVWGFRDVGRAAIASGWPSVEGVVESSHSEVQRSGRNRHYSASVVYRFTVGRRALRGTRIRFSPYLSGTEATTYPAGRAVRVYYNPSDPTDSVLEREMSLVSLGMIFSGLVQMVAGVAMGRVGRRRAHRRRPPDSSGLD